MANKKSKKASKIAVWRVALVIGAVLVLAVIALFVIKGRHSGRNIPEPSEDISTILSREPSKELKERGVVIDAGHGGIDPGAISTVTGAYEDSLNLSVAKLLKAELESRGIPVIMTRETEDAIAPTKDEDMAKRRSIIYESNAAAMISIHMNSFPDNEEVWGPQTHYQEGANESRLLAASIQSQLNRTSSGTRGTYSDNLYVLNGDPMPAVLVECGFLTNPTEAERLMDTNYQRELCLSITAGLMSYFG